MIHLSHCLLEKQLEDMKALKRSSDLHNNVKIGQGHLWLIMKHILFYHIYGGCCYGHFCQETQNKVMNTPSNNPVISEKNKTKLCSGPASPVHIGVRTVDMRSSNIQE